MSYGFEKNTKKLEIICSKDYLYGSSAPNGWADWVFSTFNSEISQCVHTQSFDL